MAGRIVKDVVIAGNSPLYLKISFPEIVYNIKSIVISITVLIRVD